MKNLKEITSTIELEEFLSKKLGVKVDLVSRNALKPHIGKHILEEAVVV